MNVDRLTGLPPKQGMYDPQFEHDACGVGFVANVKGQKSHEIIQQGLQILLNLDHRGACGCEANTGDGAGILIQTPHAFLKKAAAEAKIALPEFGQYGVGMIFLPSDASDRARCETIIEKIVAEEGQTLLGWRTVPTDNSSLGESAKASQPCVRQLFVGRNASIKDPLAFERKLYVIRKRSENALRYAENRPPGGEWFYVCSLSYRTMVYKGMLMPVQVDLFFPELRDPSMVSALALVHSRSQHQHVPELGTKPSVPLSWRTTARSIPCGATSTGCTPARLLFESALLGEDIKKILPIVNPNGSDSAMFDNALELLVLGGRPCRTR
jgi:glutamate synthase domain-containing protein 1